jgi:hypothetical protein
MVTNGVSGGAIKVGPKHNKKMISPLLTHLVRASSDLSSPTWSRAAIQTPSTNAPPRARVRSHHHRHHVSGEDGRDERRRAPHAYVDELPARDD